MRGAHVGRCREHAAPYVRMLLTQLRNQLFDATALQVGLRATQVARNDGEFLVLGECRNVLFRTVDEWSNHHILPIVRAESGGHGPELSGKEQVEHECFDAVITMVT